MMSLAADSLEDMGNDMDSFDFNMQRVHINIRPL